MDWPLVLICLIILLAGFVQGLTSFGFALISMPLLAKLMPLQQAVPMVVALSLLTNIAVMYECRKHLDIKRIWLLVISSIAAAPLGTYVLLLVDEHVLQIAAGSLVVLFAVILISGKTFPIRDEKLAFVPVGAVSGLLNGSISMSGPPVALFLSNQGVGKQTFRANITAYAIILNVITISTYVYGGLIDRQALTDLSWTVPALLIGAAAGIKAGSKLQEQRFKKLALRLIIVSGIWTVISGIQG